MFFLVDVESLLSERLAERNVIQFLDTADAGGLDLNSASLVAQEDAVEVYSEMDFAALADDGVRVVSVDGVVRLVDDDVLRVPCLVGIKNRFNVRSYHSVSFVVVRC